MVNGTDNPEIQYLMIKARWMMNGGRTEEEWESLPLSTIKLLTIDYFAQEERLIDLHAAAIAKAFSPKSPNGV